MTTQELRCNVVASNIKQTVPQAPRVSFAAPRQVAVFQSRSVANTPGRGSRLVVTHARNINQERGTKNAVKSSKQSRNPKGDRNGPIDEAAGSANSYLFLAALNAAAALPLAVAPHTVADFLFGSAALPHDLLHEPLLRILALAFAGASTAAASLNLAAKRGQLGDSSFQRLNIALLAASALNTVLFISNASTAGEGSVVSFSAFWVTLLALGGTVFTAWGGYGKNSETGLSLKRVGPLPAVKKYQDDLADLPDNSGSLQATLYSVLTVALVASGALYLLQPHETLEAFFANSKGEECIFTWRAIGGGLVTLLPAMTYTLREGAKRGKLGEAPYKALNIGVLGAGSGHLAILTPILLSGGGGPFLPALLGLWGLGTAVSGSNLLKNGNA
ncbi:Meiotic nuclear division protein 1 [Trebouxia sp. C0009 RCD-2024]